MQTKQRQHKEGLSSVTRRPQEGTRKSTPRSWVQMPFWLPDLQPNTSYIDLLQTYIARPVDDHNERRENRSGVSYGDSWREWC